MDSGCPYSFHPLNLVRKEELLKSLACRRRYKIKCKKNFGIKRSRKHDVSLGNVSSLLSDSPFTLSHTQILRNFKVTGLKENFKTARVPIKQSLFCPELYREQLGSSYLIQCQSPASPWNVMNFACRLSVPLVHRHLGVGIGTPNLAPCPAHVSRGWEPLNKFLWLPRLISQNAVETSVSESSNKRNSDFKMKKNNIP